MRIAWSVEAREDLNTIYNFYFPKSPKAASKIHNQILDEAKRLLTSPYLGTIMTNFFIETPIIRELVITGGLFKIIYIVKGEIIYVYRIWDCRRNLQELK